VRRRRPLTAVPATPSALVLAPHAGALREGLAPGLQRVGPLSEIPGLLREFRVRPSTILRRAGLAADALADREQRVPFANLGPLLDACAQATGCAHFGLLAGFRWRLEQVGLPGEIAGSCATVGEALESFTSSQWLNSSGGVVYLGREKGITTLGYAIFEPGVTRGIDQMADMATGIGIRMLRELSGRSAWVPTQVTLSHRRPDDVAPYRRLFRASVRFDAEASAIHFPTAFESTRVPSGDETRHRVLAAKLAALGRESMLPRLQRMIRVAMIFGLTSGDEIAAAMALPRRTFNRRLAESGTTFRKVLETVRFEVSCQLLRETAMSVGDVAAALGYAEPSAFVRAFRRWSRTSPGAWRDVHAASGPR